jgi:hypothetical protein
MSTSAAGLAAAAGCAIILWTIALTARTYAALPARIAYPKNYGDGGEMNISKRVILLLPVFQIGVAGVVAWALAQSRPTPHSHLLTGLLLVDVVLLVLGVVQRSIMLRPDPT